MTAFNSNVPSPRFNSKPSTSIHGTNFNTQIKFTLIQEPSVRESSQSGNELAITAHAKLLSIQKHKEVKKTKRTEMTEVDDSIEV